MFNELACLAEIIVMIEHQHDLYLRRFGAGGILR